MKKPLLLSALCFAILLMSWFILTTSSPPSKVVIGILQYTKNNLNTVHGFQTGLKESGFAIRNEITYVFPGTAKTKEELVVIMKEILAAKPDLIFASPTPAALTAKEMTKGTGIPVLFAPCNDPIAAGILADPIHPEGNITGIRLSASDGQRLQTLLNIVPDIRRVLVPYTPGDHSAASSLAMLERAASSMGIVLVRKAFPRGVAVAIDTTFVPDDVDAIVLPRDGRVMARISDFVELCNERKLPLSTPRFRQVEAGALMGYGFNGFELGKQSARMAQMLLSGSPVASIPVETSNDYLFINMSTANVLGIPISDDILRRAHSILYH